MFHMEFMILYLAEIFIAALVISAAYLLSWFAVTVFRLIGKILRKGGERIGKSE